MNKLRIYIPLILFIFITSTVYAREDIPNEHDQFIPVITNPNNRWIHVHNGEYQWYQVLDSDVPDGYYYIRVTAARASPASVEPGYPLPAAQPAYPYPSPIVQSLKDIFLPIIQFFQPHEFSVTQVCGLEIFPSALHVPFFWLAKLVNNTNVTYLDGVATIPAKFNWYDMRDTTTRELAFSWGGLSQSSLPELGEIFNTIGWVKAEGNLQRCFPGIGCRTDYFVVYLVIDSDETFCR